VIFLKSEQVVISIIIALFRVELAAGEIIVSGTDTLKPDGCFIYRQKKFYVLPTQCIYVFCVDLRTNGDYFPIQH